MCEGDAFGELVRINRKFGSLGLNFKCEGLLLGMWSMGHKETPPLTKLYLTRWTFASILTVNTSAICFVGRDSSVDDEGAIWSQVLPAST
jgi:hypothetical protein